MATIDRLDTSCDAELRIANMLGTVDVPKYSVEVIDAEDIDDDDDGLYFIDTAMSEEGAFPDPDTEDYLVEVASIESGDRRVLVSRRYVGASSVKDAADLAIGLVVEHEGLETDDNGDPIAIEAFFDGLESELGVPVWVESVALVNPTDEDREAVKQLNRHLRGLCIIHEGDCRTNDDMARACVIHRRNPTGLSTGAMVGLGLAAAAVVGIYLWMKNKPDEPVVDSSPWTPPPIKNEGKGPVAYSNTTKDLSFAAGEMTATATAPPGLPVNINVADTIVISPVPMSVTGVSADQSNPNILKNIGAYGSGQKFAAITEGETNVFVKGSDGKLYGVHVIVSPMVVS